MFATRYTWSSAAFCIEASLSPNMLLRPHASVPTSCNSCGSWCWNHIWKDWVLQVSLDVFCARITDFHSSYQHLNICLPLVRLYSSAPDNAFVRWFDPFQPQIPQSPMQHRLDSCFVLITNEILLPTVHSLWTLWTFAFSVLQRTLRHVILHQHIIRCCEG